jgi:hypothetical protein
LVPHHVCLLATCGVCWADSDEHWLRGSRLPADEV